MACWYTSGRDRRGPVRVLLGNDSRMWPRRRERLGREVKRDADVVEPEVDRVREVGVVRRYSQPPVGCKNCMPSSSNIFSTWSAVALAANTPVAPSVAVPHGVYVPIARTPRSAAAAAVALKVFTSVQSEALSSERSAVAPRKLASPSKRCVISM